MEDDLEEFSMEDLIEIKWIPCEVLREIGYHDIHHVGEIINVDENHVEEGIKQGWIKIYEETKMKKYIFLFNIDEDIEDVSKEYEDAAKFLGDECAIVDYTLYDREHPKKYSGKSIWVTEDYYLLAWSLVNYEYLRTNQEEGYEHEFKLDRAIKWLDMHLDNPIYTIEQ